MYKTTNAGNNWTVLNTGAPSTTTFQDVVVAPDGAVWLVGDKANLYRSTNQGAAFTAISFVAPTPGQIYPSTSNTLTFAGDTMIVVGENGLINRSTDNGVTWRTLTSYRKAGSTLDIWADSTSDKVWSVGGPLNAASYDQVMYSSNGGATWEVQSTVNSSARFNSIHMLSSSTGYIGGTSGRVRKTTNGGASWDSVATGFTFDINNINFVNVNTGFVFGASGNVRRTENGGLTWDSVSSSLAATGLSSSSFVNDMTGWICGSDGKIAKTINGGLAWAPQNSNTIVTLTAIDMINENTGFCAGGGIVKYTTNGGAIWNSLTSPTGSVLSGMDFTDRMNGVIVGSGGFTAITNDGGVSWSIATLGPPNFNTVFMVNPDKIYATGSLSSVLKYTRSATGIVYTSQVPDDFKLSQNYPNPFNRNKYQLFYSQGGDHIP